MADLDSLTPRLYTGTKGKPFDYRQRLTTVGQKLHRGWNRPFVASGEPIWVIYDRLTGREYCHAFIFEWEAIKAVIGLNKDYESSSAKKRQALLDWNFGETAKVIHGKTLATKGERYA